MIKALAVEEDEAVTEQKSELELCLSAGEELILMSERGSKVLLISFMLGYLSWRFMICEFRRIPAESSGCTR